MGRHLIVDGYNLARSGALFLSEDPAGPEGREELCALLSRYARGKGFRLTVVFDGRGAEGSHRSRQPFKGGTAVFSSRAESADDAIRDLSRGATAGTIVVTSDRGLGGTLRGREATVVSCEEFAGRLAAFQTEKTKGPVGEDTDDGRRKGKKGEGQKKKKRERARNRLLRNL
ncbi:MAG: NYN domain-containing protein [Candidatus Deferrimicrobiaceae bacterium]